MLRVSEEVFCVFVLTLLIAIVSKLSRPFASHIC